MAPKEAQDEMNQYKMPKALREEKNVSYRVGYQAATGNQTPGEQEAGKRSNEQN
ncbi:hypothetical protein [Cytobacillus sp. NCCP-133]|uniref:hypothetical protein n=1 Tax=Cytobacillus sp. NCCP-133 TaxID=766848 RepID=UPI0022317F66|nr:hypothetical protein [Cytobacillus sp. NCCP-133]GLB60749.1 hypothetical protein NCCP133_28810 [Cytobacillus sp. NCCP-133]